MENLFRKSAPYLHYIGMSGLATSVISIFGDLIGLLILVMHHLCPRCVTVATLGFGLAGEGTMIRLSDPFLYNVAATCVFLIVDVLLIRASWRLLNPLLAKAQDYPLGMVKQARTWLKESVLLIIVWGLVGNVLYFLLHCVGYWFVKRFVTNVDKVLAQAEGDRLELSVISKIKREIGKQLVLHVVGLIVMIFLKL